MGIYDFLSQSLTLIGQVVLLHRMMVELQGGMERKDQQRRLCTKWLVFTVFLKMQSSIVAVMEILPFGSLLTLALKLMLFLPTNTVSHAIYKKVEKHLQKVKLDDYNSHFGIALSFVCTVIVCSFIKVIVRLAAYIDYQHIEQARIGIQQISDALEFKFSAINLRSQVVISSCRQNEMSFDASQYEDKSSSAPQPQPSPAKLGRLLDSHLLDSDILKFQAKLMIQKPTNQAKAIFEDVDLQYYKITSKLTITNRNRAVEQGTLTEIKYVRKDFTLIQCIMKNQLSKVIKFNDKNAVAHWVVPVIDSLQTRVF